MIKTDLSIKINVTINYYIIRVKKPRIRWARHVEITGKRRCAYRICWGNLREETTWNPQAYMIR
jgi:hypothetical protein